MANKMLDRTIPPLAAPMVQILFPQIQVQTLDNGIKVYSLQYGTQEVLELHAVFPAGKSFEPSLSVASFTAKMLQEGTKSHNSLEYARKIDGFGAFTSVDAGFETGNVSLTTLSKHISNTVPLWAEMILEPAMPESELEKLRERSLQHLDVEGQKTGYIARKEFNNILFGKVHPYGSSTEKEDIQAIGIEQLREFHQNNYLPANAFVVAVGRFDEAQLLQLLNQSLGSVAKASTVSLHDSSKIWPLPTVTPGLHYFEKADSMQATLRVGHRGFSRKHPDYYAMQVVNTFLGGYFGSRLMKNIREDKGYTYGIGSAWLSMKYDGFFVIQTDVDNNYIEPTLAEIRKELDRLLQDGVDANELDLVRNYMLGRSATSRETPSQLAGLIQNALINGFDFEEIDRKFDLVMALQPEDIKRLAQQYFLPDQMVEVVCGKM